MANSILISSDMNNVSIVDDNDKVIFSNSLSGSGVLISLDSNDELQGAAAQATFPGTPIAKSTTDAQWTLTYHSSSKTLYFIGITDQTLGFNTDGEEFSLDGKTVQIYESGGDINLITG